MTSMGRTLCAIGGVAVVGGIALGACSGGAPPGRAGRGAGAAGCFVGKYRLTVRPGSVEAGQLVTVAEQGPYEPRYQLGTQSWGTLGTISDGQFRLLWNVAAIRPGLPHPNNIPSGSSLGLAGTGIPGLPFQIRIPRLPSGTYTIRFDYIMNLVTRPVHHTLCASVDVRD
jgi:hypothetical protein